MDTDEVLVVGESLIDVIRQPEGQLRRPGGSPANVALGLGRLGIPTTLLTHLGRDRDAALASSWLEEAGVNIDPQSYAAHSTSTATVTLDPGGEACYHFDVSWDIPANYVLPATLGWLHVGSYAAVLPPGAGGVHRLVSQARQLGIPLSLDPNIRPALLGDLQDVREHYLQLASQVNVIKLSVEDCRWLFPTGTETEALDRLLTLSGGLVMLTRGAKGALLRSQRAQVAIPARPGNAMVDSIGAGDSFMAALIYRLHSQPSFQLNHQELLELGRFATAAAEITVGRAGADLPWLHELRDIAGTDRLGSGRGNLD